MGVSFTLYLAIAWCSRVLDTKGFYVAGQGIPAAASGMVADIDFTAFYIIASVFWGMKTWTFDVFENGINPQGIGSNGMMINSE